MNFVYILQSVHLLHFVAVTLIRAVYTPSALKNTKVCLLDFKRSALLIYYFDFQNAMQTKLLNYRLYVNKKLNIYLLINNSSV